MKPKQRCIDCNNEAGTKWTSYWCEDCDAIRRARIEASLTEMLAKFQDHRLVKDDTTPTENANEWVSLEYMTGQRLKP